MAYSVSQLKDKISRFGEVFLVLESGKEYEVHGTESIDFINQATQRKTTEIRVEGMRNGEYIIAEFPLDSVEHVYTHREV